MRRGDETPTPARLAAVALLLFGSGACALVYQIAWLRLLRLVFGGTTAASAAVLAIFMAGLGFGGLVLGRRADSSANPMRLYATLELGVAIAAAASPLLIALVRSIYITLGGTQSLGMVWGTFLRLALSAVVLGAPTFLMGGTLPAAVRAVEDATDNGRRHLGRLYGANTVGAVLGTLWATFVSLELLGSNTTVWCASTVNAAVAGLGFALARRTQRAFGPQPAVPPERTATTTPAIAGTAAPVPLVLVSAGIVGSAFLLMEMVWYRMLAPLLGGSTYTFGLILAVALLGIGTGGLLYAAGPTRRQPTVRDFALTCALEALCIALPYAAGDRVAFLTLMLRPTGDFTFARLVLGWFAVTGLVVLPAALVAGYQFPVLVALLGSGERQVGRHVGLVSACNTLGSILGSLAGGFGLLPILSAPGVWRAVTCALGALAMLSVVQSAGDSRGRLRGLIAAAVAVLGLLLCTAGGPTAFWRHSPIGAGRKQVPTADANDRERTRREVQRGIIWERDGVEAAIALDRTDSYALLNNGKSDGSAIADASTMVMAGLIGTIVTPDVRRVLVIGLGTGATAGWLAAVPSVEHVDVVELEPAVVHAAKVCGPINRDVLLNPKVDIFIGDGREFMLTAHAQYDLIFSEPSNPYRTGVATLFTREYYAAAASRLTPQGIFAQWLQAYEVQPASVSTVYATLDSEFPAVETWEVSVKQDLLLIASQQPRIHDVSKIRQRTGEEPYRSALSAVWGVAGAEGLYTGFIAAPGFAQAVGRDMAVPINTDDRTILEFQFARSVGRAASVEVNALRRRAAVLGQDRPAMTGGTVDWTAVEELRDARAMTEEFSGPVRGEDASETRERALARKAYGKGKLAEARQHWLAQSAEPASPMDTTMLAALLADAADPRGLAVIDTLQSDAPAAAEALRAEWYERARQPAVAGRHLAAAFMIYRNDPWSDRAVMKRSLDLALRLALLHPELADMLFEALSQPFAVRVLDNERMYARLNLASMPHFEAHCSEGLAELEPHVPWDRRILQARVRCYERQHHPLAPTARAELATFRNQAAKE